MNRRNKDADRCEGSDDPEYIRSDAPLKFDPDPTAFTHEEIERLGQWARDHLSDQRVPAPVGLVRKLASAIGRYTEKTEKGVKDQNRALGTALLGEKRRGPPPHDGGKHIASKIRRLRKEGLSWKDIADCAAEQDWEVKDMTRLQELLKTYELELWRDEYDAHCEGRADDLDSPEG